MFLSAANAFDPNQATFSAQVTAQWAGYAQAGDPTAEGAPAWPRYTQQNQLVMSLVPAGDSALVPASTLSMQHNCEFWNSLNLWPVPKE